MGKGIINYDAATTNELLAYVQEIKEGGGINPDAPKDGNLYGQKDGEWTKAQEQLESGKNIKTLNGVSVLGEGNIDVAPTIGENGNWFINGKDTGKPANGKDGADGVSLGEIALVQETGTGTGSENKVMSQAAVTRELTELSASKQSVLGSLFAIDATADDLGDLSKFVLDLKYVGNSLDKNKGYTLREVRKSDNSENLLIQIKDEDNNNSYYNVTFKLSGIPTDLTRNYHEIQIGDFYFVFNWDYFKDFLYQKGNYPGRKLNNSFVFSKNIINNVFKQVSTNTSDIAQNKNKIEQLNGESIKKSEVVIDEANLYNKLNNENKLIIKEGDTYTKESNKYYSITDFLPYNSTRTWEYSGCTTGNYINLGCIAYFSEKSEESYLGAKIIPKTSEYQPLTGDYPEAKFVKFTLRLLEANDIDEFSYYRKSVDLASLKNKVTKLGQEVSKLSTKLLDFSVVIIDAMGDSYTDMGYDDNRGFMFFGAKILGIEKSQINSYGIGGTKIAKTSSSDNDSSIMVNRVSAMQECDIYTLMGGYNDGNAPFDNWDEKLGSESTKDDTTTIFGACCGIIEGYRQKYPYSNAIPVLMTYPYAPNDNKKKLNQCLRDVADYYNAPIIDFEKLCGFVQGKNCQIGRENILDSYIQNWISGKRPDYKGSDKILSEENWGYIPDYIPRPENAKILWVPINCNLHQYQYIDGVYKWLKQSGSREAELLDECTHIRFAYYDAQKGNAYIRVEDGTFVCDGDIHPNLLGFKKRMATVWAAKMKELLFPLLVE